jgi:hypothetical protein
MNIFRITMVAVPLVLFSSSAFADSQDNKGKGGAAESLTPTEQPTAGTSEVNGSIAETPTAEPPPAAPPQTEKAAPAPAVGTTQTTAAEVAEPKMVAAPSPVGERWSMEPLIGYGTNDFNFGVGGRAGYTFRTPVYVGGTLMWHAGDTNNILTGNGVGEAKRNFYYPGVEVGYDIGFGREGSVMVRPYGGAAILFERDRVSANYISVANTTTQFMIYPALTARYQLPRAPVFVGADTRLLIPVDHGGVSYQAFFVAGLSVEDVSR